LTDPEIEEADIRHKANQYDDVVRALEVCDGGRYRNDTITRVVQFAREKSLLHNKLQFALDIIEVLNPQIVEANNLLSDANDKWLSAERRLRNLRTAALALRSAQRAYMEQRGNEELGQKVGEKARQLDKVLLESN
jgi:hypothetical protein